MPDTQTPTLLDYIRLGEAVAAEAEADRQDLRWNVKPGDPEREALLAQHLELIDDAMRPLRAAIGRLTWKPLAERTERRLRAASQALQYQRKQLKKMRRA